MSESFDKRKSNVSPSEIGGNDKQGESRAETSDFDLDELIAEIDSRVAEARTVEFGGDDKEEIEEAIENNVFPRVVRGKFQEYLNALESLSRDRIHLAERWNRYLDQPAQYIDGVVKNHLLEKAGFSDEQIQLLVEKIRSLNSEISLLEEEVRKIRKSLLDGKKGGNMFADRISEEVKKRLGISSEEEVSDEEYLRTNLSGYKEYEELEELRALREKINDKIREKFEKSGVYEEVRNRVEQLVEKIKEHWEDREKKFRSFIELAERVSRDYHPEVRKIINEEIKEVVKKGEKYAGRLEKIQKRTKFINILGDKILRQIIENEDQDEIKEVKSFIKDLVKEKKTIKEEGEIAPWLGKESGYYYSMLRSLESLIPALEFAYEKRNNGKALKVLDLAEEIFARDRALRMVVSKRLIRELFGKKRKEKQGKKKGKK